MPYTNEVDRELRLRAVNTAADSENKIHDDSVAASFGFEGGLVPGVTVYGYLAEAAFQHFGAEWLAHGAFDVRFDKPVYDGDEVTVHLHLEGEGRARLHIPGRASGVAWIHGEAAPPLGAHSQRPMEHCPPASRESLAAGTALGTLVKRLDLSESRMSAPLDPAIGAERLAHPAVLLALANEVLVRNVVLGPWIHVASEVRKFSAVRDGEGVSVLAKVEDAYERKGHEFVVLDVLIVASQDRVAEKVRHTAIWKPRGVVA